MWRNAMSGGLFDMIAESRDYIRGREDVGPEAAVIIGTGLAGLAEEVDVACEIPYPEIPHFPKPTLAFHEGKLLLGTLGGKPVVAMDGRYHYYEGFSLLEVTFPVRVMRALGAETLVVSNAAGGLNPDFSKSDLMIIEDHINLMGVNPLVGPNDDRLGPRYPDMCSPYDPDLIALARDVAASEGFEVRSGVYAAMTGPCLETRAEYRALQRIGADAIGMSTVPEIIVAVHAGFRNVAVSCITDMCIPDELEPADIEKIIAAANDASPYLRKLVHGIVTGVRS
jgi:purine-nucleoside phosphorylase